MQIDRASNDANDIVPVSVIIPCYRCADTIGRAVYSVVMQTARPAEIWLVDDASDDNGKTQETIASLQARYADAVHLEVIALPANGGPAVARNTAWEKATQPLLAFLDADDVWHPRKLEIQYAWMMSHPAVVLTGHAVVRYGENSEFQLPSSAEIAEYPNVWQVTPNKLLHSNYFPTRSVMLRRDIPYRFDSDKRRSEDYLLWLQITCDGHPAWRLELPLASSFKAPFGEAGLTGDLWNMEKGELDTFIRLHRQGRIGGALLFGSTMFSLCKYARRWLIWRWSA